MATKRKTTKARGRRAETDEATAIMARLARGEKRAVKKRPTHFTAWSFSRYSDYRQCPRKAKLKHIDKIEEPPNDAMRRGADIGRLAELYIKGKVRTLPKVLDKFKKTFASMRDTYKKNPQRMVVEDQWALDGKWARSEWFAKDCVVRIKVDAGRLESKGFMLITDWKTGKYRAEKREEYVEQLELYCLGALVLDETLEKVQARLAYLDEGIIFPEPESDEEATLTFTRADIPKLKRTWDKRTRAMLLDRSFPPRPNDKCRWCHYRKENSKALPGGKQLCQY